MSTGRRCDKKEWEGGMEGEGKLMQLRRALEAEVVDAVCRSGLDFYHALAHEHRAQVQ